MPYRISLLSVALCAISSWDCSAAETAWLPLATSRGFVAGPDGLVMTEVHEPQDGSVRIVQEQAVAAFHFEVPAAGPYRLMAFGLFAKRHDEETRYTVRKFSISNTTVATSRIDPNSRSKRWVEVGTFQLKPGCYQYRSSDLSPKDGVTKLMVEPRPADGDGPKADGGDLLADDGVLGEELGGEDLEEELEGTQSGKFTTSPLGLPKFADLVTGAYLPRGLVKWGPLEVLGELGQAKVVREVSTDRGATWQRPASRDLSDLPTDSGLQVRLSISPTGRQAPVVSGLRVSFERKEEKVRSLSGKDYRIDFTEKGEVVALYHRGRRIGDTTRPNLFGLRLRVPPGQTPSLSARNFEFKGFQEKPKGLALRFVKDKPALEVEIEIQAGDDELSFWTLTVNNRCPHTIDLVRFPTLGDLTIHQGPHQRPRAMVPESLWSTGRGGSFPGNMSMGWSCWQGEPGSVFLASLDPTFTEVQFSLPLKGGLASISTTSRRVIPPGESFRLPYALAIYSGDWHRAADWYRELSRPFIKRPEHPRWAKYTDGWFLGQAEDLCYGRRSVTSFPDARWIGLDYCQTWYTGDGEFVGNFGYCSPTLGTPEQHRLDAKRMAEHGGHFGYYIQDQEFVRDHATSKTHIGNTPKERFPEWTFSPTVQWYEANSIRYSGGSPKGWAGNISSYKVTDMRHMCLGAEGWRKYIVDAVRSNVQHYGCSTQYIDQLSCSPQRCWNKEHEHGIQCGYHGPNSVRVAREVVEACRKLNPDFALAAEGMSCLAGQYVNFHLASSRPYRDHGKNFLYTFPEALIFRGYANGCFRWTGLPMAKHMRDLYLFHRYDFCEYSPLMREILLLRQRIKDWMYDARFMDDVGLKCEPEECRAKWSVRRKPEATGTLINFRTYEDGVSPVIELTAPGAVSADARCVLYLEGGTVQPIRPKIGNGVARFELGPFPMTAGTILMVQKCSAEEALRPYCFQDMGPGPDRLIVRAVNVGTKAASGTWRIECDAAVKFEKREGPFTVEAGEVLDLAVPITDLWKLKQRFDAKVIFSAPAKLATYECTAIVAPPLVNGGFELDSNNTGCPDYWWSRSNGIVHYVIRHSDDFLGYDLLAKLDNGEPAEGKECLRLDGAAKYEIVRGERARKHAIWVESNEIEGDEAHLYDTWQFSTAQMLVLKPSTMYRLAFRTRCGDRHAKGGASCPYGPTIEIHDRTGQGKWREDRLTIRTPKVLPRYPLLSFYGDRGESEANQIWVDHVEVLSVEPIDAGAD